MRLNGNYCGEDESKESHATSLEAIIMRAEFACHWLAERRLLRFTCSMLHVILIQNAAGQRGSRVKPCGAKQEVSPVMLMMPANSRALAPGWLTSTHWMRYVPLFVEIKAEACEDQGEERHEDSDGDGAAVGGAAGVGVDERYVFPHAQAWWRETLRSVRSSV